MNSFRRFLGLTAACALLATAAHAINYAGDYVPGDTVDCNFGTVNPSTGASFTLGGTPAISVYKDNGTTESTTGVTLTADFDSRTGLNHLRITTVSDGTFYSAGSFFEAVITTGTVNSVSVVGQPVCTFTLTKTSPLRPTVAGRPLDVTTTGEAGIDLGNMRFPTGAIAPLGISDNDTAQAVSSTSLTLASGTPIAADTRIVGNTVFLPATGITGIVTAYVSSTKIATVTWSGAVTPTGTPAYVLFATAAGSTAVNIADAVLDDLLSGHTISGSLGERVGRIPNAAAGGNGGLPTADASNRVAGVSGNVAGSVASVSGNVGGNLVGNVNGNVSGSVGSIAAGGITAPSFGADSITAAKIAADVTPEIQSGLATASALSTVSTNVGSIQTAIAALNNLSANQIRDMVVETQGGGVSLGCVLSAVGAYVAGDLTTTTGNSTYKDPSGSQNRITGIVSSPGNRLGTIVCPTYP